MKYNITIMKPGRYGYSPWDTIETSIIPRVGEFITMIEAGAEVYVRVEKVVYKLEWIGQYQSINRLAIYISKPNPFNPSSEDFSF